MIFTLLINNPPRALDERSVLQGWVALPPGAQPAWAASGLSHGAAWGRQASLRCLALRALGPAGAARPGGVCWGCSECALAGWGPAFASWPGVCSESLRNRPGSLQDSSSGTARWDAGAVVLDRSLTPVCACWSSELGLALGSQKEAALTYGWKKLSSKGHNSSQSCWKDCQTWRLSLHLPFSSLNWECLLAGAVPPLLAWAQPKIHCYVSEGLLIWQIVHALPCCSGVWSKTQTPIFRFLLLLMGCGLSTKIFMNQISKGITAWWGCRKDRALRLGSSLPSNTFLDSQ